MTTEKNDLLEFIKAEIDTKGPIPFSRYMEICLYHSSMGYYQKPGTRTGKEGDFFTAPHVHSIFGRTLANWLGKSIREIKVDSPTFLELGPGNGQLAEDILSTWTIKDRPTGVILVETSSGGRNALLERLSEFNVSVFGPEDWENLSRFSGFVVANEFFDALPLRLLERAENKLLEIHVDYNGHSLEEVMAPARPNSLDPVVEKMLSKFPSGHRFEYAPEGRTWLFRVAEKLKRGFFLILDYGETVEALSVPWRSEGTLRCYREHRIVNDPLSNPGQMDITAHVNFTLLREWAMEAGFTVNNYTTQSSFLIRSGILDLLAKQLEGREGDLDATKEWLTVKNLLHDESGMGEVFKVMVLKKE